jgi:hypothetical protein
VTVHAQRPRSPTVPMLVNCVRIVAALSFGLGGPVA